MDRRETARRRVARWGRRDVLTAAVLLISLQLGFRAWAAWSGWYFLDDLVFLRRAEEATTLGYLLEPYSGHLMPGGKLVMWAIASVGPLEWWPAVLFLLVAQLMASSACLWMLVTLFGTRRAILGPLTVYLFLSLSVPSFMWFVAALQQLPLQVTLALGVGTWVRYVRSREKRWLAATVSALVVGLFFWQKALVLLPLLLFLSVFYYTDLRPGRRLSSIRSWAVGFACITAVAVGYLALYVARVPGQFSSVSLRLAGELADTMLGTTLTTGLVGGPWRWRNPAPPNAFADPPAWAVHVAWVVVFAVIAYALLRRQRSWPALLLLVGYVLGTYLLVLTGRGTALGGVLGSDSRYLSDVPLILALCLGLAFLELPGAVGSSRARRPEQVTQAPRVLAFALAAAVTAGAVLSSAAYVRPWHTENAAHPFFTRLATELTARGRVDFADRVLPEDVMSQLAAPANNFSYLAPLVGDLARFPDVSPELAVVGDDGSIRRAVVERGVDSEPGPEEGCGWRISDKGLDVPMAGDAFDFAWWMRIGYLSSADSPVTISAGRSSVDTQLRKGLNDLYLRVDGGFDSVTIDGLDDGTTLCVDKIEVGQAEPGEPMP